MRRTIVLVLAGAVALVAVLVIGLSQTKTNNAKPTNNAYSTSEAARRLSGSPAPLAALHRQADQLLGGGKSAVKARLAALRGHPVVLNKWASWCGPCRAEFPFYQRVGVDYGRRVAFLGLNAGDNDGDARGFLKRFPVPYPSYTDPREKATLALGLPSVYPITVFYGADGSRRYVHQGGYATQAELARDIERYALRR